MGLLEQARMVAISDGRATYVVFASAPTGQTQDTTVITAPMWGRSYALYEDPVLQDVSTAASFLPVQRSAWLYLPVGVAFKCDNSDGTPPSVTAAPRSSLSSSTGTDTTTFMVQSRTGGKATGLMLPYVKFDVTGEVVDASGNVVDVTSPVLRLLLFEGTASNAGVETLTRRVAVTAADAKKYALDEILLKPTTGRAHYTLDSLNNLTAPVVASN